MLEYKKNTTYNHSNVIFYILKLGGILHLSYCCLLANECVENMKDTSNFVSMFLRRTPTKIVKISVLS